MLVPRTAIVNSTDGTDGTALDNAWKQELYDQIDDASATVKTLTDGATVAMDASLGTVFRLAAAGDRTLLVPTNPTAGQRLLIQHFASGGARTLTLTTGSSGAFRFGSTITTISQTASGKTDYIEAVYNATDSRWDVIGFVKGF